MNLCNHLLCFSPVESFLREVKDYDDDDDDDVLG